MKEQLLSKFCVDAREAAAERFFPRGRAFDMSDACDMAHQLLVILHPEINQHDIVDGVEVRYTELSQDLFNTYLEDVEEALEEIGLVRTDTKQGLLWVIPPVDRN